MTYSRPVLLTDPVTMDLEEFRAYLEALQAMGIVPAILPCAPGRKVPAMSWRDWPPGRIYYSPEAEAHAILTGHRSGGLTVLDVDTRPGQDGFATLAALEAAHGPIPATLQVRSPSGGLHLYLLPPSHTHASPSHASPSHPGAWRAKSQSGQLGPGLDVRGEGGIVLCAGSRHPTRGGHYRIER